MELRWKREGESWVFGGLPGGRTGKEIGLLLRLSLLKNLEPGKVVLSVGCGTAAELRLLKKQDRTTVGLDPERRFLLEGSTRDNATDLIQAVGENIPLHSGSFDLVLLFEVLEHVAKPEVVLEEIKRALKPEGMLFVTVPNRFYPLETHGVQICQKQVGNLLGIGIPFFSLAPRFLRKRFERARIYTEAELVSLLKKQGFKPFIVEYMMPPLDIVRQTHLTKATRQIFLSLGKVPMIKKFGATLMVLAKK